MAPNNERDLDDAPDAILAGRAADQDVHAFEVLVRRYGPLMRAYARRVLGATNGVDDVVQETFITAWEQLPRLKDLTATKSWLMKITSRKAIDRIRATREQPLPDGFDAEAPASQSPAQLAELHSQRDVISATLAAMPAMQRQCWVLRELGGYRYDEIARDLGVPTSTVRGLLARARRTLVHQLEKWR